MRAARKRQMTQGPATMIADPIQPPAGIAASPPCVMRQPSATAPDS